MAEKRQVPIEPAGFIEKVFLLAWVVAMGVLTLIAWVLVPAARKSVDESPSGESTLEFKRRARAAKCPINGRGHG